MTRRPRPRLTAVLCNYNYGHLLERCIDAYLTQSRPADQLIVWDDASNDGSHAVLERKLRGLSSVVIKVNSVNRGHLQNCQEALELSADDYMYFGASDDLVLPGFFEKAMDTLERFPDSGFFCSNHEFLDVRSHSITRYPLPFGDRPRYFSPSEFVRVLHTQRAFAFPSHTVILDRKELQRAGGFPAEHGFRVDWFYQIVIAARRGFCYHPDVLARYSVGSSTSFSATGVANEAHDKEIMRRLLRKLSLPEYAEVQSFALHPAIVGFNDTFMERFSRVVHDEPEFEHFRNAPAFSTILPRHARPRDTTAAP